MSFPGTWYSGECRLFSLHYDPVKYDEDGIFTGCFVPSDATNKQLTVFYSSIRKLPFHWASYPKSKPAGLSMAVSKDGGETWIKSSRNPLLNGEPNGTTVTGFRDPYIANWPVLDQIRGESALYAIISGGLQDRGPQIFIYAVQPGNLSEWDYLGTCVDLPTNFQPSRRWSGNYGVNWECTNFMTLSTQSASRHFLIIGSEIDTEHENFKSHASPRDRAQLWMSGNITRDGKGTLRFRHQYGGFLDHGDYYAANSFIDPLSGRRVVYGWIPECHCPQGYATDKGWNGCQAIPREIFLQTIPNVTRALRSPLSEMTCMEVQQGQTGSLDLYTLGVRPIAEFSRLRHNCLQHSCFGPISLPQSVSSKHHISSVSTPTWELESIISVDPHSCARVGFHIQHSLDCSVSTTISFDMAKETISVLPSSIEIPTIENAGTKQGAFTLFALKEEPGATGRVPSKNEETFEKLHLRIIIDGDVLELFANDRFALATMVYNAGTNATKNNCNGITAFAEAHTDGGTNVAVFEQVKVWDGLNGLQSLISKG